MHRQLLHSPVKKGYKILSGREENKRLGECSPLLLRKTFPVIRQRNCNDCRQTKGGGIDEPLQTRLAQPPLEGVGGGVGSQYTPRDTYAQTYQMSHEGTKIQAELITT